MRNHFDSSDYLKEDFDWGSEKSASKYYRYSMSECYKYYSSYFRSVWDFEEVFHITMEKLNKVVYEQPEKLKKVEDTLKFTMTVFKNSAIDYIKRKGKFYNELNEEDIIEEDGMVLEPVASKNMGIDEVFMKMDATLENNPKILSPNLYKFYHAFKKAVLDESNDKSIKQSVMHSLGISGTYYGKLKSQMIDLIRYYVE